MATTNKEGRERHDWKGQGVEPRSGDEAERAADRAEGNEPIRADAEAARQRQPEAAEQEAGPAATRAQDTDAEDAEEKIADIAEEHRDQQDERGYPPRGKL
jgi:hypothetical protein